MTVGVISDTHGTLRPEAIATLNGVDLILHAGDVGSPDILEALRALAPTVAVRGNVDTGDWANALPMTEVVRAGDLRLHMLHDLSAFAGDAAALGYAAVISGHSHRPHADLRNGVLFLNPGAAGPRRFKLPVTVARLHIEGREISYEIIQLQV